MIVTVYVGMTAFWFYVTAVLTALIGLYLLGNYRRLRTGESVAVIVAAVVLIFFIFGWWVDAAGMINNYSDGTGGIIAKSRTFMNYSNITTCVDIVYIMLCAAKLAGTVDKRHAEKLALTAPR